MRLIFSDYIALYTVGTTVRTVEQYYEVFL